MRSDPVKDSAQEPVKDSVKDSSPGPAGAAARGARPPTAAADPNSDLGFGRVLSQQRDLRLLNRDGSFNVQRRGRDQNLSYLRKPCHDDLAALFCLCSDRLWCAQYALCDGFCSLRSRCASQYGEYWHPVSISAGVFFSIHTSATIGYGDTVPVGMAANILVALESVVSLLGLAVVTGLVFARFSRPVADILFSRSAVISKWNHWNAFEFRIINTRNTQIIDLHARVMIARFEAGENGAATRRFYPLVLERENVAFFPLSWTVVHVINESSPLFGVTREQLLESAAEFLILLTGVEETFSQVVNARSSYRADEVIWNAKFADVFVYDLEGRTTGADLSRFHDTVDLEQSAS